MPAQTLKEMKQPNCNKKTFNVINEKKKIQENQTSNIKCQKTYNVDLDTCTPYQKFLTDTAI